MNEVPLYHASVLKGVAMAASVEAQDDFSNIEPAGRLTFGESIRIIWPGTSHRSTFFLEFRGRFWARFPGEL